MNNSENSIAEDIDEVSEEEKSVRKFAIQMLKNRIFLGHFQERRYVEPLQSYRDVVVINNSETDLKKDVDIVKRKLREFYENYWIGITDPCSVGAPNGHCIWIESDNNPLGCYWYKIKGIRYRKSEIILKIKVVRPMTAFDDSTNITTQINDNFSFEDIISNFSWEIISKNIKTTVVEYLTWCFTVVLTVHNLKEAITFVSICLVTTVTLFFKGVAFLLEFTLKFMRESSYFVQSATPVMISVVNLVGKIFGGFYLLILAIWRDSRKPAQSTNYSAVESPRFTRPSITY